MYGEFLAYGITDLALRSVSDIDGSLVLVADFPADEDAAPPLIDARFAVNDMHTGAMKGVVEITQVDYERHLVFLECVETTVPLFWEQLGERAPADSTPPANMRLDPMTYPYPTRPAQADTVEGDAFDEH